MLKTVKRARKQISNLSLDIEIVNPIESKGLFGGCNYGGCGNSYGGWNCGNTVYITQTQWSSTGPTSSASNSGYGGAPGGGESGGGYGGSGDNWIDNNINEVIEIESDNYDNHICKQFSISRTCATIALSYVANHFNATGLTSSDFAEMSGNNYDFMYAGLQEGLTPAQLATIMANVFQSTQISTYEEIALNANSGVPVLATINGGSINGGNTIIGHEVVITSLNTSTGEMTYMDSLTGGQETTNLLNQLNPTTFIGMMYAVTGVQNNAVVNQYKNDSNDVSHCSICGK